VPSGRLMITTPNCGRLRLAFGGIERYSEPLGDHLHLYTRRALRELLEGFAFEQITIKKTAGGLGAGRLLLADAVREAGSSQGGSPSCADQAEPDSWALAWLRVEPVSGTVGSRWYARSSEGSARRGRRCWRSNDPSWSQLAELSG